MKCKQKKLANLAAVVLLYSGNVHHVESKDVEIFGTERYKVLNEFLIC